MSEFTVLGLLGNAGNGKDLVADWLVKERNFVKIAFADPMKRFVSNAFGIREDVLWGPSEKRDEEFDISESWWYEAIGHFGDASKEIINDVLLPGKRVEGYLRLHDWLTELRRTNRERISARIILQTLGTEWGRTVDPTMWVEYTHSIIQRLKERDGLFYSQFTGPFYDEGAHDDPKYSGVVIPDHRFRNEVEYTREKGGYVLRLIRLSKEGSAPVGVARHKSEVEQKELPDDMFDLVLKFPEGIENVHQILEAAYESKLWEAKSPDISISLSHS